MSESVGSGAWWGEGSDSRVRIFLEELLAQGRPSYLSSIHVSRACLLVRPSRVSVLYISSGWHREGAL